MLNDHYRNDIILTNGNQILEIKWIFSIEQPKYVKLLPKLKDSKLWAIKFNNFKTSILVTHKKL